MLHQPAEVVANSVVPSPPLLPAAGSSLFGAPGGYRRNIFGAGTEEFKRVGTPPPDGRRASASAATSRSYTLSRGFFVLAFVHRRSPR